MKLNDGVRWNKIILCKYCYRRYKYDELKFLKLHEKYCEYKIPYKVLIKGIE